MTLTFDFSKSGFEKSVSLARNGMADWHGTKGMWVYRKSDPLCDLDICSHPWSWPWMYKFWISRNKLPMQVTWGPFYWHGLTLIPVISNYANPVYDVATICHQVRWLRWGHPSLFHTATSLLIWYKIFCVRDISYGLIWMEFINMFSVYAQSGTNSRFNW